MNNNVSQNIIEKIKRNIGKTEFNVEDFRHIIRHLNSTNDWVYEYNATLSYFINYYIYQVLNPTIEENDKKYSILTNPFHYILNMTNQLISDLNINEDVISQYLIYQYLINHGFLSYQNEFKFEGNAKKTLDILGFSGLSIMTGKACCRHIADLICQALKKKNYDINRMSVMLGAELETPNHAVILGTYDNSPIVLESTCTNVYEIKNNLHIYDITYDEDGKMILFDTYVNRIKNIKDLEEQRRILEDLIKSLESNPNNHELRQQQAELLLERRIRINKIIEDNQSILNDYNQETQKQIKYIHTYSSFTHLRPSHNR